MLRWEDSYGQGPEGQSVYQSEINQPRTSLEPEYILARIVLSQFGFDTSLESIANYRKIFKHYYRSATDYDHEVINSVYYMRNNRLMFYTTTMPQIGDKLPESQLYTLYSDTPAKLSDLIATDSQYTVFAAFSTS